MLGARDELRARGFIVDTEKSRQFADAVTIVRHKAASGVLRRKVIIHLGTNGILIQASQCDAIAKAAGAGRHVFLVTVTGPTRYPKIRKAQNTRLRACADRHANTSLLDWYGYSRGHGGWFYDGMHLTGVRAGRVRGVPGVAHLLARARSVHSCAVACPSGRRDTPGKRVEG